MKIFRIDGQPSRDDECEHGFRRFEKCPHCLADEIERLRAALEELLCEAEDIFVCMADATGIDRHNFPLPFYKARAALGEKE